jgi:hypothetical protein
MVGCGDDNCNGKFPSPMNIGLCVPSVCSADMIKNGLGNYAVQFLNKVALPIEFAGVDGVKVVDPRSESANEKIQIELNDLVIMDSQDMNEKVTDMDYGKISVLVLLHCLMLLVIASTIIEWINKKTKLDEKGWSPARA